MPALLELQRALGAAITDAGRTAAAAPLFRNAAHAVPARLAVYRGNVYGNRANALGGAYPVVRKIVGAEFFDATAREFARTHRSASADLNEYGERFAEFLAAFEHTRDLPYLPDVARMEWLAHRAYFAADAAPFDPARLAAVPPERWAGLRPLLAPACALLVSDWPLARVWTVHQDDYRGPLDVDLSAGPERILVHRPRWKAEVRAITAGDHRFLAAVQSGATLGDALAGALAEEAGFDAAAALARWVASGVVIDLADAEEAEEWAG
ncbi:MAG: putative DNA-binding domain-containing protein [Burkholderiales bacterium]|nr:putative DNA-binding domain-containing protein [Burkholderiales bacterium]